MFWNKGLRLRREEEGCSKLRGVCDGARRQEVTEIVGFQADMGWNVKISPELNKLGGKRTQSSIQSGVGITAWIVCLGISVKFTDKSSSSDLIKAQNVVFLKNKVWKTFLKKRHFWKSLFAVVQKDLFHVTLVVIKYGVSSFGLDAGGERQACLKSQFNSAFPQLRQVTAPDRNRRDS